ncbi:MAG: family 10 glycosylhydrolase [Limnochordaceae bacterium]|nr:family 10 glycosylhydrolase [Limnochordaceae bacterium]
MMRGRRRCAARLAAAIVLAGALAAGAGPARGAAPAAGGDEQPSPVAVEMRGIWVDNGTLARLGGPEGIGRLMRQVRQAGFNSVLVETIYRGNTLFPGPYQDPRFARWGQDPLEAVIREARAQGLFVHAWVWALAAGIYGRPGPLLADHPEWADRNLAGSAYSGLPTAVGWLDPSRPEVREWIAEQAAMLAHRYGVDGIHLDYARYNDDLHDPFGYSPHAQQAFRAETGVDLAGRAPQALPPPVRRAWAAWREEPGHGRRGRRPGRPRPGREPGAALGGGHARPRPGPAGPPAGLAPVARRRAGRPRDADGVHFVGRQPGGHPRRPGREPGRHPGLAGSRAPSPRDRARAGFVRGAPGHDRSQRRRGSTPRLRGRGGVQHGLPQPSSATGAGGAGVQGGGRASFPAGQPAQAVGGHGSLAAAAGPRDAPGLVRGDRRSGHHQPGPGRHGVRRLVVPGIRPGGAP